MYQIGNRAKLHRRHTSRKAHVQWKARQRGRAELRETRDMDLKAFRIKIEDSDQVFRSLMDDFPSMEWMNKLESAYETPSITVPEDVLILGDALPSSETDNKVLKIVKSRPIKLDS